MRLHNSITLIVVTVLTVLLFFSGCGTKPEAEETTAAEEACIELIQKVPIYYEDLMFWDVEALRSDNDLSEIYGIWNRC